MSAKNDLDQYFTHPNVAKLCIAEFEFIIPPNKRKLIIEPSAGSGAFIPHFDNVIALDIEPQADNIIKMDFFEATVDTLNIEEEKDCISILGNPPFGKSSSLAVRFFNHSATLASTIAFIVPNTFKKTSIQNKLDLNFHLIYEYDLPKGSFLLDGESYHVPCVFQIWIWKEEPRIKIVHTTDDFILIKKKDADKRTFCVRRAGGKAGTVLKGIQHTESSTHFIKPLVDTDIKSIIESIDFTEVANNTVGTKSVSFNEIVEGYNNWKLS